MKRIETWVWLVIVLALLGVNQAFGQTQTAGTYDPKTGTVAVDIAKEIVLSKTYGKAPIKVSGKLDKEKPQPLEADIGYAIRIVYQTNKHMLDENGEETAYWNEDVVDGFHAELYSDRIVVTQFNGQKIEITGVYYLYNINTSGARHSPVSYYWDAASGSDLAAGDIDNPYKTMAKFNRLSALAGDDFAYFKRGQEFGANQTGQDGVSKSDTCMVIPTSGTAGHVITISAYGTGADPIISAARQIQGWTEEADHIFVAATNITGAADSVAYAMWKGAAKDSLMTRIRNLTAGGTTVAAHQQWQLSVGKDSMYVYLNADADTTWLWKSKGVAVLINAKDYITINNMTFQYGSSSTATGRACLYTLGTSANTTISSCLFDGGLIGLTAATTTSNCVISNSMFRNMTEYGCYMLDGSAQILNTSFVDCGTQIKTPTAESGIILRNNLHFQPTTFFINSTALYLPIADHNMYVASSLTNKWNNGTNHSTLLGVNGWSSAIGGQDSVGSASSTTTMNIFDSNYRPLYGSPIINAGINVSVTTDYDGNTRGSLPDIGAFERLDSEAGSHDITLASYDPDNPPEAVRDKGYDLGLPFTGDAPDIGPNELAALQGAVQTRNPWTIFPNKIDNTIHNEVRNW